MKDNLLCKVLVISYDYVYASHLFAKNKVILKNVVTGIIHENTKDTFTSYINIYTLYKN